MKYLTQLLALTLCLPAAAAFGQSAASKTAAAKPATAPFNWLYLYELSSYKEQWTATIQVQELKKDLPKVLSEFKSRGAELTQPLANFAASKIAQTQQLSYRLTQAQAEDALLAVKKDKFFVLGLRQLPATGNVPMPEVDAKINALMAEKKAHRAALAKMPAISSLVDQMLDRLVMVKEVQQRAQTTVLFDITVSGKK